MGRGLKTKNRYKFNEVCQFKTTKFILSKQISFLTIVKTIVLLSFFHHRKCLFKREFLPIMFLRYTFCMYSLFLKFLCTCFKVPLNILLHFCPFVLTVVLFYYAKMETNCHSKA